jgi:hypothetical protein
MIRLQIVGGGRMGEALLGGLLDARWAEPAEIAVVERVADRRDQLTALFPGVVVTDAIVQAEGAVIAVKPGDVADTCRALAAAGATRVLSIAAGIKKANSTDTEKMIAAMRGLQVDSPFGKFTYRAIDHQATMGAYVGVTTVNQGRGVMKDFRYIDGAAVQPSDAEVRKLRPADAMQ